MQDKLRVGVVIDEHFHPEVGGGFSYMESIVNAIDKHQFNPLLEFIFIDFSGDRKLGRNKECISFREQRTNSEIILYEKRITQINKIPGTILRVRLRKHYENRLETLRTKEYNERKIRIVNWLIQNGIDILYYTTSIGGGEFNFPFIATHWDIGHYSMFPFPEVAMDGFFEERERWYENIYKKAFAIFCESESGKDELAKYKQINPERIFVVPIFPSGIVYLNISEAEQLVVLEDQFSVNKKKYFLYPAQFWAHKNHYHLLLAFKIVLEKYPDIKLVLPGSDKGNSKYIKEVIKNIGMEDSVILPGFITNEALYSLYKNAISLVMPTMLGPTNMPLLEAAGIGCPVITSDLEGHREIMGRYATYIDPLDENSIAQAMIHVLENAQNSVKVFENNTNSIDNAIEKLEENFLKIRRVRKLFGSDYKLKGIAG